MPIQSVIPSSRLILCHPLLLLSPIPSSIRVFSNESFLLMRWPKNWSFNFSITPSKEIPGLISFRMDWLDLLAVQGTLKSLQHHSQKHQFFITPFQIAYLASSSISEAPCFLLFQSLRMFPNISFFTSSPSAFRYAQASSTFPLALLPLELLPHATSIPDTFWKSSSKKTRMKQTHFPSLRDFHLGTGKKCDQWV